jgi:hypothetical protein
VVVQKPAAPGTTSGSSWASAVDVPTGVLAGDDLVARFDQSVAGYFEDDRVVVHDKNLRAALHRVVRSLRWYHFRVPIARLRKS